MALKRIETAAERLFGKEFSSLNADLLSGLPAVDELARDLAAGRLTSLRAGLLPPAPSTGSFTTASGAGASGASSGYGGTSSQGGAAAADSAGVVASSAGRVGSAVEGSGGVIANSFPNWPPQAFDDYYDLHHDTTLQEYPPGVMWNDIDMDPLTASLVSGPTDGELLEFNSNGSFTYTPPPGWKGSDSFTYEVSDGEYTDEATVYLEVINYPPLAADDGPYYTDAATSLVVNAPGVLENDSDFEGDPRTPVWETGPFHGTLDYLNADGSFKYTPDGTYVGTDTFTYYANDGLDNSLSPATVSIDVARKVDLDAAKILHNAQNYSLDDDVEATQGAYVPRNDDDDDYDANNFADYLQTGPIVGESDLLPIVLKEIQPVTEGGEYVLDIPANVRVWQNADRTGEVKPATDPQPTTFDATVQTILYVEGVATGSGFLTVDWSNRVASMGDADSVKVNVFSWVGPLNVPDYSIHTYSAFGGADGMGNSKWLAPVNGSLGWSSEGDTGADLSRVKWNGGPAVGKAVYQAHPDYIWDLEVNVVQVLIEPPDTGQAFSTGTPYDFGTFLRPDGVLFKMVSSGSPGITWQAKVTLNGPNGDRGIEQMRIGFVQDIEVTTLQGAYNTVGQTLTSSIQGNSYLDYVDNSTPPYYSVLPGTTFFNPTRQPLYNTETIGAFDHPRGGPPLTFDRGGNVDPGDDVLDSMNLVWDFDLYVTARTVDPRNSADSIYTARAIAGWQFDGSGTVGQSNPYPWTGGTGAGVTAPGGWTSVTDGSQPPLLGGEQANHALRNDTWS